MSHSEDEDDFMSADENVDSDEDKYNDKSANRGAVLQTVGPKEPRNKRVIHENSPERESEAIIGKESRGKEESVEENKVADPDQSKHNESILLKSRRIANEEEAASTEGYDGPEDKQDEEEDDEEAALAERIRERNLKIARSFAKSLQASAPIPVKPSPTLARRDRDYSDSTLGSADLNGSFNPPAPPPTPALSSSFNNPSDHTNQSTSAASPSLSTQYNWRVPLKSATNPSATDGEAQNVSKTTIDRKPREDYGGSQATGSSRSSEQARLALDRLSEKLFQPEKNLFEQVADDIRNMSITGDDSRIASEVTSQLTALPSTITDLGSTLGGWGWSGATKLLSSATQVTSQVGSVLNSLADVSQQHLTSAAQVSLVRQGENPGSSSERKSAKND